MVKLCYIITNNSKMTYFVFSSSSFSGKKSNELLMGGLTSLKSAANTVVKKFDEIKEAISTNNTPIKDYVQFSITFF